MSVIIEQLLSLWNTLKVNDPPVNVTLLRISLAELDNYSLETLVINEEVPEVRDLGAWTDFEVTASTDELHDTGLVPPCNALYIIRLS